MRKKQLSAFLALFAFVAVGDIANGDIVTTLDASSTTYSTTLNFDEPGGPTGVIGTGDFQASHGITSLNAGDGVPQVGDWATAFGEGWLGTDNSFFGNFGVFIEFDSDLTAFATQIQDPSGPPTMMGGGAFAFIFNDGVEVSNFSFEPSWGGVGDQFLNITTTDGDVFDEIRILGFGFDPRTYVDDLSWNTASNIPEPTSAALLAVFGIAGLARRRR